VTHTPEIGADFSYQTPSGTKNRHRKSTWTTQKLTIMLLQRHVLLLQFIVSIQKKQTTNN